MSFHGIIHDLLDRAGEASPVRQMSKRVSSPRGFHEKMFQVRQGYAGRVL